MTPTPSGVVTTNDGVTAPYFVSELGSHLFAVYAEVPASEDYEFIDIHGLNGSIEHTDWPPTSNIDIIEIPQGEDVLRVISADPWAPAPFNLNFEVTLDEDVYEFYITFV